MIKRYIARIVTWSVMSVAMAMTANAQRWINTTYDFGAFEENDGKVTCHFRFINDTDEPLAVLAARPSCGCTVPSIPRGTIAPGDTASIDVTYDPTGRPGRFEKNVKVQLSGGHPESVTLKVRGVVIGNSNTLRSRYPVDAGTIKLRTRVVPFGEVSRTRSRAEFIEVYNASADTVRPEWVNIPRYMRVSSTTDAVPPGEQIAYALTLVPAETDIYGILTDSIAIVPAKGDEPFVLDVIANVVEDFSTLTPGQRRNAPVAQLSTAKVDMGVMPANGVSTATFEITNSGKDPLRIRRVYTADPGVTVTVDREVVKRGKSSTVTVTVDPAQIPAEIVNARVAVITNDPDNDTQIVRIVGQM